MISPLNNCTAAKVMAKQVPLYLVKLTQSLICLATITIIIVTISPMLKKTPKVGRFHPNLKILLACGSSLYLIHSVFLVMEHLLDEFTFHINVQDPCFYLILTWKCLLLRAPLYFCIIGFTFLHLSVFVERSLATFYISQYEKKGGLIGILISTTMFTVTLACTIYLFANEDFGAYKSYCMSTSAANSERMIRIFHFLLALDFPTTIGDFILLRINRRQLREKSIDYSVRKSYQLKENKLSIRLIFPLAVTHSLTFTAYLLFTILVRTNLYNSDPITYTTLVEVVHMSVCLYTTISAGMFLFLSRRLDKRDNLSARVEPRQETDIHFQQLSMHWDKRRR